LDCGIAANCIQLYAVFASQVLYRDFEVSLILNNWSFTYSNKLNWTLHDLRTDSGQHTSPHLWHDWGKGEPGSLQIQHKLTRLMPFAHQNRSGMQP